MVRAVTKSPKPVEKYRCRLVMKWIKHKKMIWLKAAVKLNMTVTWSKAIGLSYALKIWTIKLWNWNRWWFVRFFFTRNFRCLLTVSSMNNRRIAIEHSKRWQWQTVWALICAWIRRAYRVRWATHAGTQCLVWYMICSISNVYCSAAILQILLRLCQPRPILEANEASVQLLLIDFLITTIAGSLEPKKKWNMQLWVGGSWFSLSKTHKTQCYRRNDRHSQTNQSHRSPWH